MATLGGSEMFPAVSFSLLVLFVPRSPHWLMLAGKEQKALEVLTKIMNATYAQQALGEISASLHRDQHLPKVKLIGQGFGWVVFYWYYAECFPANYRDQRDPVLCPG